MEVKICGITRLEDALFCAEMKVAALGIIFHKKSPRYLDPAKAAKLLSHLPEAIVRVGVFVDLPRREVIRIARDVGLDMLQLHGRESPDYCRAFEQKRLIKAVFPGGPAGAPWAEYPVHAFLIDTFYRGQSGGTGKTGNWEFAARASAEQRVILAGGLNPANIAEAIIRVKPAAVDINSGVEITPGVKDRQKISKLLQEIDKIEELPQSGGCFLKSGKTSEG